MRIGGPDSESGIQKMISDDISLTDAVDILEALNT